MKKYLSLIAAATVMTTCNHGSNQTNPKKENNEVLQDQVSPPTAIMDRQGQAARLMEWALADVGKARIIINLDGVTTQNPRYWILTLPAKQLDGRVITVSSVLNKIEEKFITKDGLPQDSFIAQLDNGTNHGVTFDCFASDSQNKKRHYIFDCYNVRQFNKTSRPNRRRLSERLLKTPL